MRISHRQFWFQRVVLVGGIVLISGFLNAGVVKTYPDHSSRKIIVGEDGQVLIWAEGYSGDITSSSMDVSPSGPQKSGSGASYTVSFPSGTEGNAYTCTLTLTHTHDDEVCTDGKTFTYTVYVPKMTTETLFSEPSDTSRTKLGLGEEVECSVAPIPSGVTPTWSSSGAGGTVPGGSEGSTVLLTAADSAGAVTVTTSVSGIDISEEFTVVAPTVISHEKYTESNLQLPLSVSYNANIYVGPADVNFGNTEFKEGGCSASTSGYFTYQEGLAHPPSEDWIPLSETIHPFFGTEVQGYDAISGGALLPVFSAGHFYTNGTFTWAIPQLYKINSVEGQIVVADQVKALAVTGTSSATLGISKTSSSSSVTYTHNP